MVERRDNEVQTKAMEPYFPFTTQLSHISDN